MKVAIVGSGNIGSDLMYKLLRSKRLELVAMIGIDPASEGLARARELDVVATADGTQWLLDRPGAVDLVFEATSASVHRRHAQLYEEAGIRVIDLTPAAVGPAVVPVVNARAETFARESNVNLVTCGGQATVPIVAAVSSAGRVLYAEIVSAVASRSAGPGTRQNIDEFTRKTAEALCSLGGAGTGKAIIVLNPAEPPLIMTNTVYCALDQDHDPSQVFSSVLRAVEEVRQYVPGYRLKAEPLFDDGPFSTPGGVAAARVTVLLEVEGAGDYLAPYAGNLDIMTAAAVDVGERLAAYQVPADEPTAPLTV